MIVRLMAFLNTRWARDGISDEEAGRCAISCIDVMAISGKRRADVARKSLRHLADVLSMSVEQQGDVTVIDWPKFATYQFIDTRRRGRGREDGGKKLPSPRPASRVPRPASPEEGANAGDEGNDGSPPSPPKPAFPKGLKLDPEFIQKLIDHNPLGMANLTEDDIIAWVNSIWLRFEAKKYRNRKRALVSWWSRVKREELDQARKVQRDLLKAQRTKLAVAALPPLPLTDPFEGMTGGLFEDDPDPRLDA